MDFCTQGSVYASKRQSVLKCEEINAYIQTRHTHQCICTPLANLFHEKKELEDVKSREAAVKENFAAMQREKTMLAEPKKVSALARAGRGRV